MNELPNFSPAAEPQPRSYDFFFDRLDTCLRKGRGFSLFHADPACVADFSAECERRGLSPFTIYLSSVQDGSGEIPESPGLVVLVQDLPHAEFLERAAAIADRIVFPLWFRRTAICFFSWLGAEAYETPPVKGDDLHRDAARAIRALLAEQTMNLLKRANYQLASPGLLDGGEPTLEPLLTPIEETLRAALEAQALPYQAQVRLGRQVVDFLVSVGDGKVAVECESTAHHEPARDAESSRGASLAGYPFLRFSGSQIAADVDECIRAIRGAVHSRSLPDYRLDPDLDPSQQQAVAAVSGPIRVLAPAGSGKTKTLVNRILHLLNQGIAPGRILALAFNKKARDEMQDRLERRGVRGVEVRTFHSFGYEIVRDGAGWTFGGSAQKKTARALMKDALQEHTRLPALRDQDPLDAFLAGLRRAKMELPALSTVTVEYGDKIYPLEPIFHSYVQKQLSSNFVDFDDMIYMAVRLLLEKRTLRQTYQFRFEFVLVDEFQDLNEAQLLLLQIIGLPENNIFAVGDDDQMIYGFRGADVRHILEFGKRFPVASTFVLNTNYRSSQMIVRHAGWLIRHNRDRVPKDIQPGLESRPGRFEVAGLNTLLEQARFVATWLADHKKQNNLNWRDYAVLYRYHAFQFPVAVMLDALGIPHSPAETRQLFQSGVGMDIYSYLQVILFPQEAKAADFERILKRPNKLLTNQLIAQAKDWASFLGLREIESLRGWERQTLTDFTGTVERLSQTADPGKTTAADFLQRLKTECGLAEFYREQTRLTDDLDQAGDEGLLEVITALAGTFKTPHQFFQHISKSLADASASRDDESASGNGRSVPGSSENEVYLSTIHRAKGREFRNVVYFNLSQIGADPKLASFVEEERRITYVGATRAKDDLLITFALNKPSAFLRELSLNPRFRGLEPDDLKRRFTSASLQLEKERVVLQQLEEQKQEEVEYFRELTKSESGQKPAGLRPLLRKVQLWRLDRALARVRGLEEEIKTHMEETIAPLEAEIRDLEEEGQMRLALLSPPGEAKIGEKGS